MQVKINLNNPPTTKVNVDLQWKVLVTEPKSGLLPRMFRRYNRVNKPLKITLSDISVPEDIVCAQDRLFSILYQDNIYEQEAFPVDICLSEMSTPFQLLFHPFEIKDCKRPQDDNLRMYPITFKVCITDMRGRTIDSADGSIDVIFEPLGVVSNFDIHLNDCEIDYSSALGKENVGVFAAWTNEDFMFTPQQLASISLKLYKGEHELPRFVSFANDSVKESIVIKAGRQQVVKLPLYIDFKQISNPVESEEDYTIEAKIVRSAAYSPEVKETVVKQTHFRLKKDLQGTELKIYVQRQPDAPMVLLDERTSNATLPLTFVPKSLLMGQMKVVLANIATDNSNSKAGVYIKNLTLSESVLGEIKVVGEGNAILTHFVTMDGRDVDATNTEQGLFIPNGQDQKSVFTVSFDPSKICDLIGSSSYDFKVQSIITFDYWEDKDGIGCLTEELKKHGKVSLLWKLHLEPNPEWLCVDYGSSAIVCRYDKDILNLKKRKDQIFRTTEEGKYREDSIESGTPFLSSDIVLHTLRGSNNSTLCSQQPADADIPYLNLSVCLSPTSSLIKDYPRMQLPCLKILVGNEFLPKNADFLSFQYTRRGKDGETKTVIAKDVIDEPSSILRISSIFNEAYAELFRYFILPESRDRNINKLVLTYPNTYTPAHLKILERIALGIFPKVRSGYLRFVSESDAVAAYYLQNWDTFNVGRNIKDDETVLVYDMGAGTLDITIFKKHTNSQGIIEVDILGKIGSGKAGNYLDFLIAEIVQEVEGAVKDPKTVSTDSITRKETLLERLDLKRTIKEIIKPSLLPNKELSCGTATFDSSLILENDRFKQLMSDVTKGILQHLLTYIGDSTMRIDTVLMSGRSCRLTALQNALRDALRELGNSKARIINFKKDGDQEKTVVVEGAMVQACIFSSAESPVVIRSKRLYASYGLIYQKLGGRFAYAELLRSDSLPYVADMASLGDYDGPNCIVEGTAAANTIKLVQTYLSPEDTEAAYNVGNFEFISEMEEYDMSDFGNRNRLNVRLRLDYKNNISLYVDGRASKGSSPKGIDLSSEITKKSIWPVTI